MTIKIHKILKSDLSQVDSIKIIEVSNTSGMTISHFACSVKSAEVTVPFSIEGTEDHVSNIDDVDFCLVVRKKVDLKAVGVNEKTEKDVGKDVGKYKYVDNVPSRPLDLPPGFQELYKK